jgi:hypothetical protein
LTLAVTLAWVSAARAADDAPLPIEDQFGHESVWVLSGDHGLAWDTGSSFKLYWARTSKPGGGDTTTTVFQLNPSLDYFFLDHLSLGFTFGLTRVAVEANQGTGTGTALNAGARLGTTIPIVKGVSTLWPKVSVVFSEGNVRDRIGLQAYLCLVVHSMGHFLVGFGPAFEHIIDSVDDGEGHHKLTTNAVGALVTLGGWFRR